MVYSKQNKYPAREKIAFFISDLGGGGAEKSIVELLKGFDKNKFEYTIILRESKGIFLKDIPIEVSVKNINKSFFIS
jgi:hypothetical protein